MANRLKFIFVAILFSVALGIKAQPGNIGGNLKLWLKANNGVTGTGNVTDWMDFSGNANHAVRDNFTGGATGPNLLQSDMNYNPSLNFENLEGMYTPSLLGNVVNTNFNIYFVTKERNINNPNKWYFREAAITAAMRPDRLSLTVGAGEFAFDVERRVSSINRSNLIKSNVQFISTTSVGNSNLYGPNNTSSNGISLNNTPISPTNNDANSVTGTNSFFNIANSIHSGNGDNNWSNNFDGQIAEIIFYSGNQNYGERKRIESYLAIKYGITLDNSLGSVNGDYIATDATLIWDASDNPTYHNNIIGIGRDDNESLLQKQSKTLYDTTRIYLSTLQPTNAANTGTFSSDNSYVLWGDNQAKMCETAASNAEIPVIPNLTNQSRLAREWKITKTNFTGNFSADFTLNTCAQTGINSNCLFFLVDDDGDFSNGGTSHYGNNDGTGIMISNSAGIVSVNNISTTHLQNNTTQYVTLAYYTPEITVNNDTTICSGQSFTLSAKSTDVNLTYLWDNGLGAGQSKQVNPTLNNTYRVTGTNIYGCPTNDSVMITIDPNILKADPIMACGSYTWTNGTAYTASNNTAKDTIASTTNGCDTIVTLNLTIIPIAQSTDVLNECGSYTWIDGINYTTSNNTAKDTIFGGAANGCDSIVSLDLTIIPIAQSTDVLNECGSYTWIDGINYTASNNSATDTLFGSAANGCDSIITLDLTINNPVNSMDILNKCGSYTWIDGINYTASNNSATDTLFGGAANGCDSIITLNLTINNPVSSIDVLNECGSYTWIDGINYTASNNSATDTLFGGAANGCDSIITLNLTIIPIAQSTDVLNECGSYTWIDGKNYATSNNTATDTIFGGAANGCDSIITLDLTIINPVNSMDVQTACESYLWIDGNNYKTNNNTAIHTIFGGATNGCDSIVTLNLTLNPELIINLGEDAILCNDSLVLAPGTEFVSYLWSNGSTDSTLLIDKAGEYDVIVFDSNGCYGFDAISISEDCPFTLWVPNTFTPNKDSRNNVFRVVSENIIDMEVTIFNRWGEIIQSWKNIKGYWDGTVSGKIAPNGVYAYTIKYSYFDEKILVTSKKLGHVNLLR